MDRFNVTLLLEESDAASIEQRAVQASDPEDPGYGKHLTPEELEALRLPSPTAFRTCVTWLTAHGLEVWAPTKLRRQIALSATEEQLSHAFGAPFWGILRRQLDGGSSRFRSGMPAALAPYVKSITLQQPVTVVREAQRAKGFDLELPEHVPESLRAMDVTPRGATPAQVEALYQFPSDVRGAGETIMLLNLSETLPDPLDLEAFWRANRIERPPVRHHFIGQKPNGASNFLAQLEVTMTTQWVGAMAPEAEIVLCTIDSNSIRDPWTTLIEAALEKQDPQPSVVVSTWTAPADDYYGAQGARRIADCLAQAAAAGITVVVATGDWGVLDGRPSRYRNEYVSHRPWPRSVFPASEARVLSVGGTRLKAWDTDAEEVWSGPPPPVVELRQALHFELLGTSGGFSEFVPMPDYQLRHTNSVSGYSRGPDAPGVVPYGRGYPDVALMAQGPDIVTRDAQQAALGYQAFLEGQWIDYAGGTSLAAPIWGAIIARLNQARRQRGLGRLGFVNPLLYHLQSTAEPKPFRDVVSGRSDVRVKVLNQALQAEWQNIPGYEARSTWEPASGLGVPNVTVLRDAVCAKPSG